MFATYCQLDYPRWKNKNCWPYVDTRFNVLSIHNLLPLIMGFIIIHLYRLPFYQIETPPFGKAKPSNIPALVALILLNFIHLAKWLILPCIVLFIDQYSHATAWYSPVIFLYMKFSVKQYKEACKNSLTHSVLHFAVHHIPPRFHCIDHHRHTFNLGHWYHCWTKYSGTFSQALTSRCSGVSRWSMPLSGTISDSLFLSQLSSLSFGWSNSQFQSSQYLVSEMLSGAPSSPLAAGWRSMFLIRRSFNTWFRPPGRSFADKAGGTGDVSDNLNVATPSRWNLTRTPWRSLQYLKCIRWLSFPGGEQEIRSVRHVGFICPAISPKRFAPWPFCATTFPLPPSSFPSRFRYSSYQMLGHCLPISRYWLEQTALPSHFHKRCRLLLLTAPSR